MNQKAANLSGIMFDVFEALVLVPCRGCYSARKAVRYSLDGNRSSRPKVISPETRVMSPEIFSQVGRNFNKECM